MALDVREIARRAAARVLAEQGTRPTAAQAERLVPAASNPAPTPVRNALPSGPTRPPKLEVRTPVEDDGRSLVLGTCLAETPDGGVLRVPADAIISPLAAEEAHRRRIRIERGERDGGRRIAVGCDHGGFALKQELLGWLRALGHVPVDFGTRDENPVDYPDFARAVAEAVASGQCELGIVIDGAGIGSAIAANKVPGVRAATCCDVAMAKNAREHNYANVLSLGAKMIQRSVAEEIVRAFLSTAQGEARHGKRVAKITEIERRYLRNPHTGVQT
jgi:ribose 5-phosphate isomerase B